MVYNWGLINEGVDVFKTFEDAKQAFREYTGFEFNEEKRWKDWEHTEYDGYYEQCDIFRKKI